MLIPTGKEMTLLNLDNLMVKNKYVSNIDFSSHTMFALENEGYIYYCKSNETFEDERIYLNVYYDMLELKVPIHQSIIRIIKLEEEFSH